MPEGGEGRRSGVTVLVVDDASGDREMLAAVLRTEGYDVLLARDASEALSLTQRASPDVAVIDVAMPEVGGLALCRHLRARERTATLPIILVSAVRTTAGDRAQGLEAGADDFLLKPLDREVLRARIDSLLRLKEAREELQRERNRLRALNYAVGRLVKVSNLRDLPPLALSTAIGLSGCSQGAIFFLDQDREMLRLAASEGLSQHYQEAYRALAVGQDPRTAVLVEGTRMISDVSAGPQYRAYQEVAAQEGFVAVAEIPLRGAERVWGMVALYYDQPHPFSESEGEVLVALAGQIAIVFERARRFDLEQRRRQVAEALQRVTRLISVTLDPAEVLQLILRQLRAVIPCRDAYVLLRQGNDLRLAAHQGESEREVSPEALLPLLDNPGLREVLLAGRPLFRSSIGRNDWIRGLPGGRQAASWMGVPLVVREETLGLLLLVSAYQGSYGSEMAEVAQSFARHAALAVENTRLFQQIREERRKLEAILNQTTDAVLAIDQDRRILIANPASRRLLEISPGPVRDRPVTEMLQHEALQVLFDQSAQGLTVAAEVPGSGKRRFYASVSPVEGVGHVAVMQDITPLKELEKMRLAAERTERERIRQTLERYVGPDLVDQVLDEGGGLLQRRERVEAVVLFADIRGFTSAAASLPPEDAVEMLNDFFTTMAPIVYQCEGTLIDLIGDELMASFGAPLHRPDAAQRAVEAAVALQMRFVRLRSSWVERWGTGVGLGVGIDRGMAVMGNVGTAERVRFTLIGNVVNRAHRLVEQAGPGEILLSGRVLEAIPQGQQPSGALEEVPTVREGGPEQAYLLRLNPR